MIGLDWILVAGEICSVFAGFGNLIIMPAVPGRSADRFCKLFLSKCCHQFNNQQLLKRLLKQVCHARTRPLRVVFNLCDQ